MPYSSAPIIAAMTTSLPVFKPPSVLRRDRQRMEDFQKRKGWMDKPQVSVASVVPCKTEEDAPTLPFSDVTDAEVYNNDIDIMKNKLEKVEKKIAEHQLHAENERVQLETTIAMMKEDKCKLEEELNNEKAKAKRTVTVRYPPYELTPSHPFLPEALLETHSTGYPVFVSGHQRRLADSPPNSTHY